MAAAEPPPGGESGDGRGELSPQERAAFKQRADELGRRLEAAKGPAKSGRGSGGGLVQSADNGAAMGKALRISTELIGGVVVGSALGWGIDRWLGTFPAAFIVCFLLGSAAGMINVIRAGTSIKTGPDTPNAGPSVRDDEEET